MQQGMSRRTAVASGVALGAGLLAIRGGAAQDATPTSGPWEFTDARGVTVSLPSRPTRMVIDANVAGSLWDFGVRPHGIFGWQSMVTDGELPAAAGDVDPESVVNYGLGGAEIDLEQLIVDDPDLIVTYTFAPDQPDQLWSVLPKDLERLESIAPIVALSSVLPLPEGVAHVADFATALGYDITTPELQAVVDDIAADEARVRDLIAANPGFSALWVGPSPDVFYVANPENAAEVAYARSLGILIPELDVEPADYWEELSYENALKYETDILFVSTRNGDDTPAELAEHPLFSQHPAARAGQVFPWNQDVPQSYQGQYAVLAEILTALEPSRADVVDEGWAS